MPDLAEVGHGPWDIVAAHMTPDDLKEQQPEAAPETSEAPVDVPADAPADTPADTPADQPAEAPSDAVDASADAAEAEVDADAADAPGDLEGDDALAAPEGPIEVGSVTFVVVQRITPYGAFVALSDGRSGLIHISEIDRNYVKDVREHLREGDKVEAKVTAIKEDGKIDLSIKALQDPQPRMSRGSNPEFEQMLRKFMRGSEERQVDVKRSHMRKRK